MSLHKFAEQVASQGRGDDSLLVHMTPDEVRNLQQFAQANGTTLTINPTTGLPEAGMLSDLFKTIAPIALGAFLGPAGLGMSSMMAGVATGGITTLATGSLSRGLMAGLGAYGGAGLGESLMTAGGNAMVAGGAPVGAENLVGGLSSSGATAGSAVSVPPIEQINPSNFNLAKPDVLSAGAKAAAANPMAFAKQNLGNLAYAAAPIAAGMMVPTTTKLPDPSNTGLIRQMAYNINPDTGMPDPLYGKREMTPIKASEFGDKTFKGQRDLFYQQNPNPYQNPYELGVGSLNQPPLQQPARMNTGGIVALAAGGETPAYFLANPDVAKAFNENAGGYATGLNAQQYADLHYKTHGANEIAVGTRALSPTVDLASSAAGITPTSAMAALVANPNMRPEEFDVAASQYNLNNYNATSPLIHGYQVANDKTAAAQQYLKANPDVQAYIDSQAGKDYLAANPQFDASDIAFTHFQRYGEKEGRKFGETAPVVTPPVVTPPVVNLPTGVTPTGYYGSGPATGVDYRGNTVSIATPGDIVRNVDGTSTVVPNIPGRPDGGFTGIEQLKSAYTAGGGSLGYTSPVVKTPAEHEAAYNKLTDDSLDAYNFLMGKGKNLTQRTATASRPVMRRYDEAVLGRKIPRPGAKPAGTGTTVIGTPGQPQTYFNEAEYLAANPDVAAELKSGRANFTSGYEHYLRNGKAEGRKFTGDYEGYLTAAALAAAGGAGGGGEGPGPAGDNNSATISGFTPGLANPNISDVNMSTMSPAAAAAAAAAAADGAAASAASASGNAPGSDGSPGSGAKRGGLMPRGYAMGGGLGTLGSYSDGGRLLKGPGDGVSDSIPATIGAKRQPARLADGEFVIPARIVSELGNGSTDAGAKKLYAMMDRVQRARGKTTGKNKVAANSRSDKYLPA